MRYAIVILGLLLALTTSCIVPTNKADVAFAQAEVTRESAPSQDHVQTLVSGNSEFAFDLYHQIAEDNDGNIIFSPYSISQAFAMLYAGARDETATQMADTLHFTLPPDQLHPAFNALDLILRPLNVVEPTPVPTMDGPFVFNPPENLTLTIANALWVQQDFPLEPAYVEILGSNYGSAPGLVDFSGNPDGAYETIRQWIEDHTNGRITDMPPREAITPATQLALTNAIYFKGEWSYPFNPAVNNPFHLIDGGEVSVPMMEHENDKFCLRGDGFYALQLTYGYGENENAAMLVILPDAGNFDRIESMLDLEFFRDILADILPTNTLTFKMPRFAFESEVDLEESLANLGLTLPFSGGDFTGISPNPLLVDQAVHKATISVDEQGTEATGVTSTIIAIMAWLSECGSEVTADHPFIFAIYDTQTQTILFLGRVMNPAG